MTAAATAIRKAADAAGCRTPEGAMKTNGTTRIASAAALALSAALLAGWAGAEDAEAKPTRPALGKVVVFPFEAVNVDPGTARAFTDIFQSALRARGVTVLDWRPAHEKLLGEAAPAEPDPYAAPAPPPPPPPPPPVPMLVQSPPPAGMSSSSVVTHTTAPSPPGAAAPAAPQYAPQPYYAQPQVVYIQQPAPAPYYAQQQPPPPPPEPVIGATAMRGIAREAGADQFIQGSLTRLASQIRVTALVKDIGGQEINNQVMDARTEQDLANVLERIAQALVDRRSAAETLDLDNATMHETQQLPERYKLETNMGAIVGQAFSLSDEMNHLTMLAFDARFEIKDLLVELNAGLVFSAGKSDRETEPGLLAGITLAYYLSHTSVAPYLGAGAGIYIGELLASEKKSEPGVYDGDSKEMNMGFHASPMLGVEFLRRTRIRVHVDLRWMLAFDASGRFGHGPMPMIGINF
jgi:TolB-like protein